MTIRFDTPQDTEDAYYDALEAGNLEDLLGCWEASDDVACLLPMQNLARGPDQVRRVFEPLFRDGQKVALSVTHMHWIETEVLAVHLVKETAEPPPGQPEISVYAANVYRLGTDGWRLLVHQNSPTPPPVG